MGSGICVECGTRARRSHARTASEKLIRQTSRNRLYHCHKCGWRGWLVKRKFTVGRNLLRNAMIFLLVLVMTAVTAFYMVGRMVRTQTPMVNIEASQ